MDILKYIISPFLLIIEKLFFISYKVSGDYGVSIVLLSFLISLLLLPVFIFIERAKKKDDAIKRKMQPFADEIKRCYKGQERFYYLKTLNRQYGYSQAHALIPILSLLIQIPFFIAAYQFLEGFEDLTGVGFLFIKDLSLPDGLLGSVNILPIAMTLVNLLTAYFYTRNGNTSERRQMLIVAGMFLILLFRLPSGLVLYWTMNNVFSFFRLFITNPEVFGKNNKRNSLTKQFKRDFFKRTIPILPKLRIAFLVLFVGITLSQVHWTLNNQFDDILTRLLGALCSSFILTLLLALLVVKYEVNYCSNENLKSILIRLWLVFRPVLVTLFLIVMSTQIVWAIQNSFNNFPVRILMSGAIAVAATILLATIIHIFESNKLNAILSHLCLEGKYKYLYILILIGFISAQVNWVLIHNFHDIIPRILIVIVCSWGLVLAIKYTAGIIQSDTRITYSEFRRHFVKRLPQLLLILVITGSFFFLNVKWGILSDIVWLSTKTIYWILAILILISAISVFITLISIVISLTTQLSIKPFVFYSLLFLSVYFNYASKLYYLEQNIELAYISLLCLFFAQFVGVIAFLRNSHKKQFWNYKLQRVFLTALSAAQIICLILYMGIKKSEGAADFPEWLEGDKILYLIFIFGGLFSVLTVPYQEKEENTHSKKPIRSISVVFILSVFYIAGFVFLWNPLIVYSSYPANFDFSAFDILINNIGFFILSLGIIGLAYLVTPKSKKHIWMVLMLVVVGVSFIHSTLLPINVGTLQENKFLKEERLAQPIINYLFESLMILFLFLVVQRVLVKEKLKQIAIVLLLLNTILIIQAFYYPIKSKSFNSTAEFSSDETHLISFSKNQQNVVVFIADMFHGWYVDSIIKEIPELRQNLEGFVWYPNTLSASSITASSVGPIWGGHKYTVNHLNKDKERTIQDKLTAISQEFYKKVRSKGFSLTGTKFSYSKIDKSCFDTFLPKWHDTWDTWNKKLNIGVSKEVGFKLLWNNALFYSAPIFLKPLIYNNGQWIAGEIETNENTNYSKPYNFIRLLPYISNTKSEKPSFIYLHTTASHHPWDIIDDEGKIHIGVTPYDNNKWTINTFAKWIEWMKTNEVYDNTKIILLSDHGPHWGVGNNVIDMNIPLKSIKIDEVKDTETMSQFALLMVKDFNSRDSLKIDNRFMSNLDISAIAFDENDPRKLPKSYKRTLPTSLVLWERKIWLKNEFRILKQYEVTENMFELKNWKEIKN